MTFDPQNLQLPEVTSQIQSPFGRLFKNITDWLAAIRTNFQLMDKRFTLNADGTTTVIAGLGLPVRTVTLNTTLDATDCVLLVDATAANITIGIGFLPDTPNRVYTVKKIDASANTVSVGTIDGATQVLAARYAAIQFINDGSACWAIGEYS